MRKKTVLVFVFDGYADWETSPVLSGINMSGRYTVKTLALEKIPVRSTSGMTTLPDLDFFPATDLRDIDESSTAMLILPGGLAWERKENQAIAPLVRRCVEENIPVAAISGATILLADLGLLDHRNHTSNDPDYLGIFSETYRGLAQYQHRPVVSSLPVITAGGASPMEFAGLIFDVLEISDDPVVDGWFDYFQDKMLHFRDQNLEFRIGKAGRQIAFAS